MGFNSRLDELQACFLNIKLKSLDEIISHKRKLAEVYFNELDTKFILPSRSDDYFDVYHIFNIRHEHRNDIRNYLLENGVRTEVHYPVAPHRQEAIRHVFAEDSYPISEEIHATTLSLPISYMHNEHDVVRVAELLNKF